MYLFVILFILYFILCEIHVTFLNIVLLSFKLENYKIGAFSLCLLRLFRCDVSLVDLLSVCVLFAYALRASTYFPDNNVY